MVFLETDHTPFSPSAIKSHFLHTFIVVKYLPKTHHKPPRYEVRLLFHLRELCFVVVYHSNDFWMTEPKNKMQTQPECLRGNFSKFPFFWLYFNHTMHYCSTTPTIHSSITKQKKYFDDVAKISTR